MDEKRGWLEKVLNDATADVESWPSWLKDNEGQSCLPKNANSDEGARQTEEDSARRFARGA
jgi:hypothetical protein